MRRKIMEKFVIKTQTLENYGAHDQDGKFSSGNAYWKFKGGNDYIVSDCDTLQNAVAFVMAAFSENNLGYKEFFLPLISHFKFCLYASCSQGRRHVLV